MHVFKGKILKWSIQPYQLHLHHSILKMKKDYFTLLQMVKLSFFQWLVLHSVERRCVNLVHNIKKWRTCVLFLWLPNTNAKYNFRFILFCVTFRYSTENPFLTCFTILMDCKLWKKNCPSKSLFLFPLWIFRFFCSASVERQRVWVNVGSVLVR